MTTVLSPRPSTAARNRDVCPPAGPIRGKRVGLRRDLFWRTWDWITEEWCEQLRQDGAEPVVWRAPVGKGDVGLAEGSEDFDRFLAEIDVAIMGLCNCGSCTHWAISDTATALDQGLPTVAVCTEHFEGLARTLAAQRGHTSIRVQLMPYPIEGRAESEVRQIARATYGSLLDSLGAVR